MIVFPVIERELRVRARRRGAYLLRFGAALVAVLVCLPLLMWSGPLGPAKTTGESFFDGLIAAGFVLCCAAGLLTADAISLERREGTLGLLFLTRLKAVDVLLGKLGSAGLGALCVLIALMPVLMIPLLVGGVTGGEVFRKSLALVITLLFSLAAGLWASATNQKWLESARQVALLVAATVLLPLLLRVLSAGRFTFAGALSPALAIFCAGDSAYASSAPLYWSSLIVIHAMTWVLLLWAASRLRRSLNEPGWSERFAEPAVRKPATMARPRWWGPAMGQTNPIEWLVLHQQGVRDMIWAAALLGVVYLGGFGYFMPWVRGWLPFAMGWFATLPGLVFSVTGGSLFALAFSRFFIEARRSGELELLLTTPLGAKAIVTGHWDALKQLLRWPMVVMLAPILWRLIWAMADSPPTFLMGGRGLNPLYAISTLSSAVNLFLGMGALCWVGMWFGLKARGQAGAVLWTVGLTKGVAFLLSMAGSVLLAPFRVRFFGATPAFYSLVYWFPQTVLVAIYYVWLIRRARRQLLETLAGADPVRFSLRRPIYSATREGAAAIGKARAWRTS